MAIIIVQCQDDQQPIEPVFPQSLGVAKFLLRLALHLFSRALIVLVELQFALFGN